MLQKAIHDEVQQSLPSFCAQAAQPRILALEEDHQEVHKRGTPQSVPTSASLLTVDERVSGGEQSLYANTGHIAEDLEDEPLVPVKSMCVSSYY